MNCDYRFIHFFALYFNYFTGFKFDLSAKEYFYRIPYLIVF